MGQQSNRRNSNKRNHEPISSNVLRYKSLVRRSYPKEDVCLVLNNLRIHPTILDANPADYSGDDAKVLVETQGLIQGMQGMYETLTKTDYGTRSEDEIKHIFPREYRDVIRAVQTKWGTVELAAGPGMSGSADQCTVVYVGTRREEGKAYYTLMPDLQVFPDLAGTDVFVDPAHMDRRSKKASNAVHHRMLKAPEEVSGFRIYEHLASWHSKYANEFYAALEAVMNRRTKQTIQAFTKTYLRFIHAGLDNMSKLDDGKLAELEAAAKEQVANFRALDGASVELSQSDAITDSWGEDLTVVETPETVLKTVLPSATIFPEAPGTGIRGIAEGVVAKALRIFGHQTVQSDGKDYKVVGHRHEDDDNTIIYQFTGVGLDLLRSDYAPTPEQMSNAQAMYEAASSNPDFDIPVDEALRFADGLDVGYEYEVTGEQAVRRTCVCNVADNSRTVVATKLVDVAAVPRDENAIAAALQGASMANLPEAELPKEESDSIVTFGGEA